jgi:hypothetical protein
MAVITNCALIGMNPEVKKLLPTDITPVNTLLIFVLVEVRNNISKKESVSSWKRIIIQLNFYYISNSNCNHMVVGFTTTYQHAHSCTVVRVSRRIKIMHV